MHVVDALDQRLIALLRADGRAPVSQLAAALHVALLALETAGLAPAR